MLSTAKEAVPLVTEAAPLAQEAVPLAKGAVPLAKEAVPLAKGAVPLAKGAVPLAKEAVSLAKEADPLAKEAAPFAKDILEQTSDIVDAAPTQVAALPIQKPRGPTTKRRKVEKATVGLETKKKRKLNDVDRIAKKGNQNATSDINRCESLLTAASKLAGEKVPGKLDSFKFTHPLAVVHTCLAEATLAISLFSVAMFPEP